MYAFLYLMYNGRAPCKDVRSDDLGRFFFFCSKVPEFLHVGSYLVKEHRSVFFFLLNFASFCLTAWFVEKAVA